MRSFIAVALLSVAPAALGQVVSRPPSTALTVTSTVLAPSGQAATLKGQAPDGSSSVGVILDNANSFTGSSKLLSLRNNGTEKLYVGPSGDLLLSGDLYVSGGGRIVAGAYAGPTEFTLISWWFNAAAATGSCPATGTGCIGHKLPAQAFTVTGVTAYASIASGGGAANTVLTITDGTNTCTATIPCNSAPPAGTSAAGLVRVSTANGAGTGCVYAASAGLTFSVTTAGCTTTQPTLKNIDVVGKWQ
jgi:hypothetical protein